MKRKNAEMGTEESKSLEQIRLKDRIRHRTRVIIKDQENDLTDDSQSFDTDDPEILEDIKQREDAIAFRVMAAEEEDRQNIKTKNLQK